MGIKRRSGGWLINHQFAAHSHLVALVIFLYDLLKLQETCAALNNQYLSMYNTDSHLYFGGVGGGTALYHCVVCT